MIEESELRQKLRFLENYSVCDVADVLLKLEKSPPGERAAAGFLEGIEPLRPYDADQKSYCGPAFTVQFQPKDPASVELLSKPRAESNIPKGAQWSDLAESGSVVVVQQPPGQHCAVVGGIHAVRLQTLGAIALVVDGRVRDKVEIGALSMPVWSRGSSVVGLGAESKAWATKVPVCIRGVMIQPGDIIFCEPAEGIVRIPRNMVDVICDYVVGHAKAEVRVKEAVKDGSTVADAFDKYR